MAYRLLPKVGNPCISLLLSGFISDSCHAIYWWDPMHWIAWITLAERPSGRLRCLLGLPDFSSQAVAESLDIGSHLARIRLVEV